MNNVVIWTILHIDSMELSLPFLINQPIEVFGGQSLAIRKNLRLQFKIHRDKHKI